MLGLGFEPGTTRTLTSITKLLRISAWCRRFFFHRKSSKNLNLTPDELETSLHQVVRYVQESVFKDDVNTLSNGTQFAKSNPLSSLTPFIDSVGLLRVGGSLHESSLEFNVQHPLIFLKKEPLQV